MKPLLVLARITFVGCLWSIVFIEGIRVIVLENWRFDIFWPPHWAYAWNLWQSGWIIDTRKEWAFVLILLTFIPLWLMGWIVLSLVPWETIFYRIICFPFRLFNKSVQPLTRVVSSTPVITKKKSYKEVRPVGKRVPIYDYNTTTQAPATPALSVAQSSSEVVPSVTSQVKDRAVTARETLNHTIFDLDDEDDDFDLDIDSFDKSDIFKIDSNKKQKETRNFKRSEEEKPRRAPSKARRDEYEYDDDYFDEAEAYKQRKQKNKQPQKHMRYEMEDEDDEDLETYRPAYTPVKRPVRSDRFDDEEPKYERTRNRYNQEFERSGRTERKTEKSSGGAIGDVLQEKGYDVIKNVSIGKDMADYVAVSSDKLMVCVVDKEHGDWLADEERFNDEEPLWFSENSHRISPVRKADVMAGKLQRAFEDAEFDLDIKPCVIIVAANIINAEDMLDVWRDLDVDVARFSKGGPTELTPLMKMIKPAEDNLSQDELSKLKKILKKLA